MMRSTLLAAAFTVGVIALFPQGADAQFGVDRSKKAKIMKQGEIISEYTVLGENESEMKRYFLIRYENELWSCEVTGYSVSLDVNCYEVRIVG